MRNLKRALSLALASVMLLGMMVVGSSAKGLDDFSDNAESALQVSHWIFLLLYLANESYFLEF